MPEKKIILILSGKVKNVLGILQTMVNSGVTLEQIQRITKTAKEN